MAQLELPIKLPELKAIQKQLADLSDLIHQLIQKEVLMSQQLAELEAAVAANTTVVESAITLINGLASQILELKDDPVRLATLAHDLQAKTDALAAAVQANIPQLPVTP